MRPPVHCPRCGAIFLSRAIDISGGEIHLWGNRETCINCGGWALISEGVFRVAEDTMKILAGTPATLEVFAKLAGLAREAEAGRISRAEAVKRAEDIQPGFGALFGKWISANWIGLAALLLAGAQYVDAKVGDADRTKQMERLISATEGSSAKTQADDRGVGQYADRKNRKARRADEALKRKAPKAH